MKNLDKSLLFPDPSLYLKKYSEAFKKLPNIDMEAMAAQWEIWEGYNEPKMVACTTTLVNDIVDLLSEVSFYHRLMENAQKVGTSKIENKSFAIANEEISSLIYCKEGILSIYFVRNNTKKSGTFDGFFRYNLKDRKPYESDLPIFDKEPFSNVGMLSEGISKEELCTNALNTIAIFVFLAFIDVEEVSLKPKEKYKPTGLTRQALIRNPFRKSLIIADRTWNKNITIEGGVSVIGHWRLQPYGEGRKRIKLIFIPPHHRSYSRKAGKNKLD